MTSWLNNTESDNLEITIKEFCQLNLEDYFILDIRDELAYSYGHIPEAINIPYDRLNEFVQMLFNKKVIVYCKKGQISYEAATLLRNNGIESYSLTGGYLAWLISIMDEEKTDDKIYSEQVEESIRKKYHKKLWCKFTKAINQFELIKPGDKIAVCISGGKDSMLMAKLFQELKKHSKYDFELVFLVMNPGYSDENRKVIENNAEKLQIPITVFETNIFESVFHVEKSPCYLCARMRRGHLYNKAKELGCNKIALGHHYDDVIETILMGMLYGAQMQTMMPKLHSTNFEGMELIRPMYFIREDDIKQWRDTNGLHFIQCACKFTDTCSSCQSDGQSKSKRLEVKKLIAEMKKTNPFVEDNIYNSSKNVMLDALIGYKKDGTRHSFLDNYDNENV